MTDNKFKKIKLKINPNKLVTILCQQSLEFLRLLYKDDPIKLSQNLCVFLGETLKTALATQSNEKKMDIYVPLLREFNVALFSNEIQPREKLILESMKDFEKPLNHIFKLLSYQSDANTCAAVVHNVSDLLQISGNYNLSFEIIGRYIKRFERDDPEMLSRLERGSNFFFPYNSTNYTRRGLHTLDEIPEDCWPEVDNNIQNPVSERIAYFFAIYALSNDAIAYHLESGTSNYMDIYIIEALRRKMDPDFLKPIMAKYFKDEKLNNFSMSMLTHLPWGGEHLSLFRPLLISHKDIADSLEKHRFLCGQLELAAHLGENDLAQKIHQAAFNYSYELEFENDDADYFYEACMAANMFDEAIEWLEEGDPDEWDLPAAKFNSTLYLCARGWDLKKS